MTARLAIVLVVTSAAACGDRDAPPARTTPAPAAPAAADDMHEHALAALVAFEERTRAAIDFASLPPSDVALGPDPYRIAALADGSRVGILRGESAIVLLDRDGVETARLSAPHGPSGLAVSATDVLVVGDGARELARYRADHGTLVRGETIAIDALGLRDIAVSPDGRVAYVVEERGGSLLAIDLRARTTRELGRCTGPVRVAAIAGAIATDCLLDHAIEVRRDDGEPVRIVHDGPLWGVAIARDADGALYVAAPGIEDHPLLREDGGFGYIDSFVYVYRLAPNATKPERLAAVNVSELGCVTPKWIALAVDASGVAITTAAYGSASLVTLTWRGRDFAAAPQVVRAELPPGTADIAIDRDGTLVAANPLLDAWVVRRGGEQRVVPIASARPARSQRSRVGELLLFTTMMAPWNSSEGKLSRFTCEACHFEGYGDGRVHFTGRSNGDDKVHATSRPLFGLFNNRPHFSRALDKTTARMINAEFRVANRHNGRDSWFALTRAELPWLAAFDVPERMSPEYLREAAIAFLADFSHRANPAAQDRARFTELEAAGARAFRDRCASCHAARLVADEPRTVVAFERWESLVLSPSGPIVWSDVAYAKTGVTPYVHADGARPPTLRRAYKKWPYFTNGSARSLADVLDRFAWDGDRAYHDHPTAGARRLSPDDKAALRAFLELL
jgi:DNA-binding beta-propeller fold protein YncE